MSGIPRRNGNIRRRQSPNGSPPPERVRDRRGRRGVEGEECGGVSAGGMAYAPPGRRRAFRVRSPTTPPDAPERRAEVADSRRTRTGLRAHCREYPSNCCPQTDADSRLRGAGQIRICQSRVRHGYARFGDNVDACPAVRPAGPCRQTRPATRLFKSTASWSSCLRGETKRNRFHIIYHNYF